MRDWLRIDIPQLGGGMAYDELELDRIGDRKTAVFFIISDTTQTYNFYWHLHFRRCSTVRTADSSRWTAAPSCGVLWDEAANTGQVPNLEKAGGGHPPREISLCLLYQQLAQCKAIIYDKNAETIGNIWIVFFLGREASTIKEIEKRPGAPPSPCRPPEGRSRGQSESYSQNTQRLGRATTPSELATMP